MSVFEYLRTCEAAKWMSCQIMLMPATGTTTTGKVLVLSVTGKQNRQHASCICISTATQTRQILKSDVSFREYASPNRVAVCPVTKHVNRCPGLLCSLSFVATYLPLTAFSQSGWPGSGQGQGKASIPASQLKRSPERLVEQGKPRHARAAQHPCLCFPSRLTGISAPTRIWGLG